jgi:2'-hydroxyisoflavone reductase
MTTTRRQLLIAAAALASLRARAEKAGRSLRILILGGTGFLGPQLVERAQARGHTVTLFNRGKTRPGLFPEVEKLRGDRDGKLDALKGRSWDACIDPSGYVPRLVKMSADLLKPSIQRYLFVSSISVYPDDVKPGANEQTPVQPLTEPGSEDVKKHYGALKAACEQAAEVSMPGRAINVRPGLIVGPEDPTDRFTYWPARIDRGGEAITPGDGKDPAQFVDVRDLAAFMIHAVEASLAGVYNAVGPAEPGTMAEVLAACRKVSANPASLTWIPEKFLADHGVGHWMDMPLWTGAESGFARIDARKAIAAGLRFRPAEETARDTLAWFKTLPAERQAKLRAGLKPEKEQAVLSAWKSEKR